MHLLNYAAMSAAQEVWDTLKEGFRLGRRIKEETITDVLLLRLAQRLGGWVTIEDYTRSQEAVHGADWAWVFEYPDGRKIMFRVQAKIMLMDSPARMDDPYYEQLHYRSTGISQTAKLISESRAEKMLPLYCFYTTYSSRFSNSASCVHVSNDLVEGFGASIVGARQISALSRKQKKFSDFAKHAHALPCFFNFVGSPERISQYVFSRWFIGEDPSEYILMPEMVEENPVLMALASLRGQESLNDGIRLDSVDPDGDEETGIFPAGIDRLTAFVIQDEFEPDPPTRRRAGSRKRGAE